MTIIETCAALYAAYIVGLLSIHAAYLILFDR